MEEIGASRKLEEISQINLSSKKLSTIDVELLNKCLKLEYLDLSRNRVKSLVGIYLPRLKFFNIEDNCISDVTFLSDLPHVEKLFLDGNPLNISDRYIAVDQLKNLKLLDGKSCADLQQKLQIYHAQLHGEALRIFSSKYQSAVKHTILSEQVIQQRRLFTRELLTQMSSCSSLPPKFQRYKVQDYVEKFFKSFEYLDSPQTPQKVQKCLEQSSPNSALYGLKSLHLNSPSDRDKLSLPLSSSQHSTKKEKLSRLAPSSALKYLESVQFDSSQVQNKLREMKISNQENNVQEKSIEQVPSISAISSSSKRSQNRKRQQRFNDLHDDSSNKPQDVSYDPYIFLRCHVPCNDPQDCDTQVWSAAFEIHSEDTGKTTDMVATCGGNIICIINCQTGHVVKRYKCESKSENLFSISWTTLKLSRSGQQTSILAAAGSEKKIYLIHPSQLKCYSVFKAHSKAINCLKFHPQERAWLFSGSRDSCVYLWDISGITLPNYSGSPKKLMTFEALSEVIQIALCLKYNCLFASTDKNIAIWNLATSYTTKKPSLTLIIPDSCKPEDDGVIDGLTLVSDTCLALKVSNSGKVVLWDISDIFCDGRLLKGKHQISPLAIYLWSDGDCDYSYLDSCASEHLIVGGDNAGRLWLYDTSNFAHRKNSDFSNELSLPSLLLPWPKLNFADEAFPVKQTVIINSVQFNWNGDYLVACTDTNLVCIWKRKD